MEGKMLQKQLDSKPLEPGTAEGPGWSDAVSAVVK